MALGFFSKILTGSSSQLNRWRAKFCLHATEGEYMSPRRKISQKFKKHFFFVECQRACSEATKVLCIRLAATCTVPDWEPKKSVTF